jgi:hypothetical protein
MVIAVVMRDRRPSTLSTPLKVEVALTAALPIRASGTVDSRPVSPGFTGWGGP